MSKRTPKYLAPKRQIQKYSERQVRAIAKALKVPFAVTAEKAKEILALRAQRKLRERPDRLDRGGYAPARVWRPATALKAA